MEIKTCMNQVFCWSKTCRNLSLHPQMWKSFGTSQSCTHTPLPEPGGWTTECNRNAVTALFVLGRENFVVFLHFLVWIGTTRKSWNLLFQFSGLERHGI